MLRIPIYHATWRLAAALLVLLVGAAGAGESSLWNDGSPEVVLGAYFDAAGTDSVLEGAVPDTLTVYLFLDHGGLRGEGNIQGVEYAVEIPEGLTLLDDKLPEYSNLSIGNITTGMTQSVLDKPGDHLLINRLVLLRTGELPYDARLRVMVHPKVNKLQYAAGQVQGRQVVEHLMTAQDAILNPKVAVSPWKPVRQKP